MLNNGFEIQYNSTVPKLEILTVIHPSTTKSITYSKCADPSSATAILAGELISPAAEV